MKKYLSTALAAAMALSCVSVPVFAEETAPTGITITAESAAPGNIFFDKAPVEIEINFKNNDATAANIDATYSVVTTDGKAVTSGEFEDVSVNAGAENSQKLTFGEMDYGTYFLKVTNGDKTETFDFSSAVKSKSKNTDDSLGFGVHMTRGSDIGLVADMIEYTGVNWIRDEYYWDGVEKEKGVYTFEHDEYIDTHIANGGKVLLILDYGNSLYGGIPHDEVGYAGYAAYCKAMAEHLKGRVDTFEIWNEWSGSFGQGYGPEIYAEMIKAAYPAIKEANPDATVVGCCTADVNLDWIKTVFEIAGPESMDAVSIHPYAYPSSPESGGLKSSIRMVHELCKEYGKDMPVWCTELGYPAATGVIDEETAGAYKARLYVYSKSIGEDKLFLYDFQNDGVNPAEREHNFGVIRDYKNTNVAYAAKRGYLAVSNATDVLGDAEFVNVTAEDDIQQIYQFKKDGKGILAMWRLEGNDNIGVKVGCDEVIVRDWMGNEKTVKTTNGIVTVAIDERPVYVIGDFTSYEKAEPQVKFAESKLSVAKGEEITLTLNRGAVLEGKAGEIKASLPAGFEVSEGAAFEAGSEDIKVVLTPAEDAGFGKYKTEYEITADGAVVAELEVVIDVVDISELNVLPEYVNENAWKINVTVKNNSREKAISGKLKVTEPEEYAGVEFDIQDLGFGEVYTGTIDVNKAPENKLIPLKVVLESDGQIKELSRPISCLVAAKRTNEITIDGVASEGEWTDSMQFFLDDYSKLSGWLGGSVASEQYSGEDDMSGHGYLKWDDEAFYMLVQIKDDIHVQMNEGSGIWANDGLQYCIDPSRGEAIGKNNWHEIGLVVTEEGNTHMWKWLSIPGIAGGEVVDYTGKAVRDEETTVVTYEVRIPWEQLLPLGETVSAGKIIGYSVIANEDDGKGRDGWIQYMGGIGDLKHADRFGDVILLDNYTAPEKTVLSDARYPWADEYANTLYNKGVISAEYDGGVEITKGEFVSMVVKALGKENEEFDKATVGVAEDYAYYNEIGVAKKLGIAFGEGESFDTEVKLTRQDMMTILERAIEVEDADVSVLEKYADYDKIADYAVQSFANLVKAGIIVGDGYSLTPLKNTTKAEAVTAVCKIIK